MRTEQPDMEMEPQMSAAVTDHSIALTARLSGNKVSVTGPGSATLPARSGSHRFNFTLDDQTGLNVTFQSLTAADDCTTCPPTGPASQQIKAVNTNGTSAAFTDSNSGDPTSVSYQWNFTCNDPSKLPITYDPIINNGGSNFSS
jgi:hypothetical protein